MKNKSNINMCFKTIRIVLFILFYGVTFIKCNIQVGPDPWDYESNTNYEHKDETPPDLIPVPDKKTSVVNDRIGDWFYRRLLAIVLKGGLIQKHEDGSVDISLQMKISQERWKIMEEYILVDTALTEDMFRRSMGYIEDSIYKPTISEKIVMAWSEYIQFYLIEYKEYLTWFLSFAAVALSIFWLWNHISHKHVIIMIFVFIYLYEVIVSYKEAEKQELDTFIKAVNTCKWYIWTSKCEVPPPDPLIFIKHMNPLKIAIRIFTTLISEPMLTISATIKIMVHGITDGLWYPFDTIMYGIIVLAFNVLIIFLLILILFNYILNIPFSLNFLGIIVGLKQRQRNFPNFTPTTSREENVDRISGETLTRILDVCSRALNTAQSNQGNTSSIPNMLTKSQNKNKLKRLVKPGNRPVSSFPSLTSYSNSKFNKKQFKPKHNGSGDA